MENSENRSDFENVWEKAFRDVEKSPPDAMWGRIENALVNATANHYKKRLFFFKLLAAASLLIAMGIGVYSYYAGENKITGNVSEQAQSIVSPATTGPAAKGESRPGPANIADGGAGNSTGQLAENDQAPNLNQAGSEENKPANDRGAEAGRKTDREYIVASKDETATPSQGASSALASVENNATKDSKSLVFEGISANKAMADLSPLFDQEGFDRPSALDHIYLIPVMPENAQKNQGSASPQFFAGVDFSTGVFDPNFSSVQTPASGGSSMGLMNLNASKYADFSSQQNNSLAQENYKPAMVYSYGANVGTRLGKRWLVTTGINYVKANAIANTSAYFQDAGGQNRVAVLNTLNYQNQGVSEIKQSGRIQLDNNYEFASVPIKAGYIVLDHALDIAVLAGVSSDFYLGGKVQDKNNFVEDVSLSPGEQSPYKNVYFNGIVGTAFGYSIADHYRLTLEPSYRMAINSLTKDGFVMDSNPASWQVSFGFSYQFK